MATTQPLTAAEARLLAEIADAPILHADADYRRPFDGLREKGLIKSNGRKQGRPAYALTAAGYALVYGD